MNQQLLTCWLIAHSKSAKKIAEVLREKSIADFNAHFYCNKEHSRDRAWMFYLKDLSHVREVTLVKMFVKENLATKEHFNEDLKSWFKDFIAKCKVVYFEGAKDVSSDGLNLQARLRSSNHCEHYHKKLELAIGSWIVSLMLRCCISLFLICRHNVNSNIKRHNGTHFGYYKLQLIDRAWAQLQQLCNVTMLKIT